MIEAVLKVVKTMKPIKSNPLYGRVEACINYEHKVILSKDTRDDIAPTGVMITMRFPNGDVLVVKADRHYLENDYDNCYTATFTLHGKVFEISVWFDECGKIEHANLAEWDTYGCFEDGESEDTLYDERNNGFKVEAYN